MNNSGSDIPAYKLKILKKLIKKIDLLEQKFKKVKKSLTKDAKS